MACGNNWDTKDQLKININTAVHWDNRQEVFSEAEVIMPCWAGIEVIGGNIFCQKMMFWSNIELNLVQAARFITNIDLNWWVTIHLQLFATVYLFHFHPLFSVFYFWNNLWSSSPESQIISNRFTSNKTWFTIYQLCKVYQLLIKLSISNDETLILVGETTVK